MSRVLRLKRSLLQVLLLALGGASACNLRQEVSANDAQGDAASALPRFVHCNELKAVKGVSLIPLRLKAQWLTAFGPDLKVVAPSALPEESRRVRLGVLADTRQAHPQTLANLDHIAEAYRRAKVDAIVMLGGIDPTFAGTTRVLRRISTVAPLLALPGDRISVEGFQAAVREVGPPIVDFSTVRSIQLPWLTIVGIAGYYRVHHLAAGPQGCSYTPQELNAIADDLNGITDETSDTAESSAAPLPRLLISYGPPHGEGVHAVDRAFGRTNIGDPALNRFMRRARISFGLFAHVHESGGNATTLEGTVVAPNAWTPSLLLNVGSADAIPHQHTNGSWETGMAAVVEIDGAKARYWTIRLSTDAAEMP